jgi:hypothetical protein
MGRYAPRSERLVHLIASPQTDCELALGQQEVWNGTVGNGVG